MVKKADYLKNPCGESSIPYWKAKVISIPAGMKILHETEFDKTEFHETDSHEAEASQFVDEPYLFDVEIFRKINSRSRHRGL